MSRTRWRSVAVMTPEDGGLHVVVLRRRDTGFERLRDVHIQLSASLLADAEELVARDLRDRLREGGIHERRWVLAVPPSWLVARGVSFPDVRIENETEFLWLQAEQALPNQAEQSALAVSRHTLPGGTRGAVLFVLRSDRLNRIRQILTKAGLRLLAAAPAAVCEPVTEATGTTATMISAGGGFRLQVDAGGGLLLLRDIPRPEGGRSGIDDVRHVQRQLRIVLASLPSSVQGSVSGIEWIDEAGRNSAFAGRWNEVAGEEGGNIPALRQADAPAATGAEFAVRQALASTALASFTVRDTEAKRPPLLRRAGRLLLPIAACAVAIIAPVVHQAWRLRSLEREMDLLGPKAEVIEQARTQVKELSPWYDQSPGTLNVLKAVTHAFPEYGTVWLTRFTIAEGRLVELSGKATDTTAWLAMQDALRQCPRVSDLRISQTRTTSGADGTMAFGISFTWEGVRQ